MSAKREAKMRLLLRKAERSRELEPFIQKLMEATQLPHDSFRFLSLEESDQYKAVFDAKYIRDLTADDKLMVEWDEPEQLHKVLLDMSESVSNTELLIFFQDSDVLGALVLPARIFFSHAGNILNSAGDCLHAVFKDATSGIMLDFYEEGSSVQRSETLGWGNYRTLLEGSVAKLYPSKLVMLGSSVLYN